MKKSRTKSLLAYPGAKNLLGQKYEPYFPPHRVFLDPFSGSGGVFMQKQASSIEVWNDMDDWLYDMFSLIQDECEYRQLVDLVRKTRNTREQYFECRRILNAPRKKYLRVRSVYPDQPPSLKFRDPATKRLDLPTAWPQVRGFRPNSLDACVSWCEEGFNLHPEWTNDLRLRWAARGNVLLKVLRILQGELDDHFQGRFKG